MVYDFKKMEEKIGTLSHHLESEIASLRTGRATPALLESIRVEAYGVPNPLKNVASIVVEDAKTLLVQPWDKSLIDTISKAIEVSNIGSQPVVTKDSIRISLPSLTEERRKQLGKVLKEKLEESKITLRKIRDEVWKEIQEKEKDGAMTEDDKFSLKKEMEKRSQAAEAKLDEIAAKKEKEIME